MANQLEIHILLEEIHKIATAGFALALHVRFTTPTFLFQTYAKEWLDYYSQNGFVMYDPSVAWAFKNTGAIKWSALAEQDPMNVLTKAAEYGMKFGTVCGVEIDESHSIGGFARADREFDTAETETLVKMMRTLHALTADVKSISPETSTALRTMSVQFTHSQ
jgi:LuxR family transcriptional regulator